MAHPKLLHPTPTVAMKYSPILEAIVKLETLSQMMHPTSEITIQSDEAKETNVPTSESHASLGEIQKMPIIHLKFKKTGLNPIDIIIR